MTLKAIKVAIEHLPEAEQVELESWLAERWDAQMARDFSPRGAGASLMEKVKSDVREGKFKQFSEGRPNRR
jgi:hypothetical protein